MIHGELDSTASPVIAKQFAEEKGAEFILFPGAEHQGSGAGQPGAGAAVGHRLFQTVKGKPSGTVS